MIPARIEFISTRQAAKPASHSTNLIYRDRSFFACDFLFFCCGFLTHTHTHTHSLSLFCSLGNGEDGGSSVKVGSMELKRETQRAMARGDMGRRERVRPFTMLG
jgi:hypothetical protein